MARRLSILGLVAGLLLMGPAPMSACLIWMPLSGGCEGPAPAQATVAPEQSDHCEHMAMTEPASDEALRASSDMSCCIAKNVPLASQQKQTISPASADSGPAPQLELAPITSPRAAEVSKNDERTPPDIQPLLCIFLI